MQAHTGFLDDLSNQQKEVMLIVKRFITEELQVTDTLRWNDWYVLRFCRARKFDVKKVQEMIQNYVKWLINMKLDKVGEIDIHKFDKLRQLCGFGYYSTDKKGRPIYIDEVAKLNTKEVFEAYQDEDFMAFYIQSYDRLIHIMFPECSRLAGKRIEQTCSIMNLDNVNTFKLFSGKIKAFMKIATDIAQDYYPEILGNMYIINAGMLFSGIWMVIKPWIDPKTQAKISIISGSGKKDLLAVIDPEHLPVSMGGTCTRAIQEDYGPWSDEIERSHKNKTVYHHDQELINRYYMSNDEKQEQEKKRQFNTCPAPTKDI